MHDPMVVAWDVPAPWLRRAMRNRRSGDPRWGLRVQLRTNPENLGERVYAWYRLKGYRLWLAGVEYSLSTLVTIWHVEPGGRDSGEVCKHHYRGGDGEFHVDNSWRWHVHHWRPTFPWARMIRRRLLTRCAWCGGPSRKGGAVNCSLQWDGPDGHWWQGEPGLFHSECSGAQSASRTCTCAPGTFVLAHRDYGQCSRCGLFRPWTSLGAPTPDQDEITALYKTVPVGRRPSPELMAEIERVARLRRAEERVREGGS